jgi:hypothetical protein
MTRDKMPAPGALAAVNAGIQKANALAAGKFRGLLGSLPEGTSIVLADILAYLRQYLFDERRLSKVAVWKLLKESLPSVSEPRKRFRSVAKDLHDEGVTVALGVLNSIASAARLDEEKARLLLSGTDGLRGAKVRKGGGKRGSDTTQRRTSRIRQIQQTFGDVAHQYPKKSYRDLARTVAGRLSCSERTVRRHTQNPRNKKSRDTTS